MRRWIQKTNQRKSREHKKLRVSLVTRRIEVMKVARKMRSFSLPAVIEVEALRWLKRYNQTQPTLALARHCLAAAFALFCLLLNTSLHCLAAALQGRDEPLQPSLATQSRFSLVSVFIALEKSVLQSSRASLQVLAIGVLLLLNASTGGLPQTALPSLNMVSALLVEDVVEGAR